MSRKRKEKKVLTNALHKSKINKIKNPNLFESKRKICLKIRENKSINKFGKNLTKILTK